MPQSRNQLLKPSAVPGGLNRYNNLSLHASIESNYLLSIVFEFTEFDLAIGGITVTNCLLTSMKINSAVYCHGCLLLRPQTHNLSLTAHSWGETPFFITSDENPNNVGHYVNRRIICANSPFKRMYKLICFDLASASGPDV